MSGPQENLRVLQSYEAEYARRVAFAEEGFRDPKVLAGDWGCKSIWRHSILQIKIYLIDIKKS